MNKTLALIFSYKRPLQLSACLKSLAELCCDYENLDVAVLYKVEDERFKTAYKQVFSENSNVMFFTERDFRRDVLSLINNYTHVMFLTDDNIFVEEFHVSDATRVLYKNPNVLGFSLRLGLNTTYCYPVSKEQKIPDHTLNKSTILWNWEQGDLDFGYPLEVSSSIYRVVDVNLILERCQFSNPNQMEFVMDFCKSYFDYVHPLMASYKKSVAFCAPVNKVKEDNQNKSGLNKENSIDSLLTKYENGGRIDVNKLVGFIPNACHQEIDFDFYNT